MKIVVATDQGRIAPLLDAARCFLLVTTNPDGSSSRQEVFVTDADPITKARSLAALGATVLVCGAISWPLEATLTSAGVRVVFNTCGPVDEVLSAFFAGHLTERAFLMPGCPGRRNRHRHRHGRRGRCP